MTYYIIFRSIRQIGAFRPEVSQLFFYSLETRTRVLNAHAKCILLLAHVAWQSIITAYCYNLTFVQNKEDARNSFSTRFTSGFICNQQKTLGADFIHLIDIGKIRARNNRSLKAISKLVLSATPDDVSPKIIVPLMYGPYRWSMHVQEGLNLPRWGIYVLRNFRVILPDTDVCVNCSFAQRRVRTSRWTTSPFESRFRFRPGPIFVGEDNGYGPGVWWDIAPGRAVINNNPTVRYLQSAVHTQHTRGARDLSIGRFIRNRNVARIIRPQLIKIWSSTQNRFRIEKRPR